MKKFVIIHGHEWKWNDIEESVEWACNQTWIKKKWVARPALISRGQTSEYVGQKYDNKHTNLVEDGWDHDHCEICWWQLHESDDSEHGIGFTTDGHTWICVECFEQFVSKKK